MYVPPPYRPQDPSWTPSLIRENPLATLVTVHNGEPIASNVPVIIGSGGEDGSPMVLLGHMNRVNPHWKSMADGESKALLLFSGPQAYISPAYYEYSPAAPTWNFCVVQAAGRLTLVDEGEPTLNIIKATVREFEGRFGAGWSMTESLSYFQKILAGVGAFSVQIERLQTMYKMSQDQSSDVRTRVEEALEKRTPRSNTSVSDLMRLMHE